MVKNLKCIEKAWFPVSEFPRNESMQRNAKAFDWARKQATSIGKHSGPIRKFVSEAGNTYIDQVKEPARRLVHTPSSGCAFIETRINCD
jgi:hypothetical protein